MSGPGTAARIRRLARAELAWLARSRVAWLGLGSLLLLAAVAAATSGAHVAREAADRAAQQHAADALFDGQPARHPHRVVHYGTYVHRPPAPLAAFDPGVDPYTGTTLYLEGHRQNAAAFGAARESSGLLRFGLLTPAFVLQVLAPLLLAFVGYAAVAREREGGQWRLLLAHGARPGEIVLAKALALGALALVAAAPALTALAVAAARTPGEWPAAATVAGAHVAWLAAGTLAVVAVSALARSARAALLALVTGWAVLAVAVPRVAAEVAARSPPLPTRVETDLAVQAALRAVGDSHDAGDPAFVEFRRRVLERYGVARIEDLPVNFRGLVSYEGEKRTTAVLVAHAAEVAAAQRAQRAVLDAFALASPALAVRRASQAAAGSDLENHLRFLDQGEAHRFDLVQRLNRLHVAEVAYADDVARSRDPESERRTRVAATQWRALPDFAYAAAPVGERVRAAAPALAALGGWLAAAALLALVAVRRLRREP